MAIRAHLETPVFIGTHHRFVFSILNDVLTAAVDVSAWSLSFMVKRQVFDGDDAALIVKTTDPGDGIAVSGIYNASPSLNTQVITVSLDDDATDGLPECIAHFELKRMDTGAETVLAYGTLYLRQGVHQS